MSLAEVFYLPKSEPVEQERRVADIDDGYTRFANELLEAIASADLTARQLKVMLAYVRKTYGFNKKTDRISANYRNNRSTWRLMPCLRLPKGETPAPPPAMHSAQTWA